jgi:hypothetical protein
MGDLYESFLEYPTLLILIITHTDLIFPCLSNERHKNEYKKENKYYISIDKNSIHV